MNQQINNYNSDSINNFKILALILVVFIFGILTGIGILQFTTDFDDNINQKEEIKIANASIWVTTDQTYSQAAIILVNQANTTITIQQIAIGEIEYAWSDVYFWSDNATVISEKLKPSLSDLLGSNVHIIIDGTEQVFQQANTEITLNSTQMMVVYLKNPGNTTFGVPSKITVEFLSENEVYSEEVTFFSIPIEIVESKSVDISKIQYTTDGLIPPSTIVILTLKNTGTSNVTIGNIKVNGVSTSFAVNVSSTLEPKGEDIFTLSGLTADLTDGSKYRIDVFDVDGQLIG